MIVREICAAVDEKFQDSLRGLQGGFALSNPRGDAIRRDVLKRLTENQELTLGYRKVFSSPTSDQERCRGAEFVLLNALDEPRFFSLSVKWLGLSAVAFKQGFPFEAMLYLPAEHRGYHAHCNEGARTFDSKASDAVNQDSRISRNRHFGETPSLGEASIGIAPNLIQQNLVQRLEYSRAQVSALPGNVRRAIGFMESEYHALIVHKDTDVATWSALDLLIRATNAVFVDFDGEAVHFNEATHAVSGVFAQSRDLAEEILKRLNMDFQV